MGISIVFGGQFGSEGKGKVARYFADQLGVSAVVRVGGSNSGHTVIDKNGRALAFRCLPTAALDKNAVCILPAGSYIDVEVLFREMEMSGISPEMVKIHPNAAVITEEQIQNERNSGLIERIGSTGSGTGAAVRMRVDRSKDFLRAAHHERLASMCCDTEEFLREELNRGHEVLIEGTQGFGLSNLHSPYYPYATSRDTSAAGFLSETGLSPFDVTNIIMVIRAFPIRVAGESGPLPREIEWSEVSKVAGKSVVEQTTVTKKLRRVAEFDADIVRRSITANRPNIVILNHCDYFDYTIHGMPKLSETAEDYIKSIESSIGDVNYIGTGEDMLFLR